MAFFLPISFFHFCPYLPPQIISLSCRPFEIVTGFVGRLWTLLLHSKVIEIPHFSDLKILALLM